MPDYRTLALQQLDPSYNAKIQALKNATASQLQNLEQSKGGINQNYDLQVDNQNLNNTKGKNNYSNSMLGRGLGRSSIVGTGLAEQDQVNNRFINQINSARTGALNNIDQQKSLIQNNTDASIGQMQGDKESELATLMRQLEDRDWDKNFKQKEFDTQTQMNNDRFNWEKQTQAAEQAFKEKQFLADQAYKSQQLSSARKNVSANSAFNKEVSYINDLVNGKYNLSDKLRTLQSYVDDYGNREGDEAASLYNYAKQGLAAVNKQMSDYVNSGRYAGYENRRM